MRSMGYEFAGQTQSFKVNHHRKSIKVKVVVAVSLVHESSVNHPSDNHKIRISVGFQLDAI